MPAAKLTRDTIASLPVPSSKGGRVVQRVTWDRSMPGFGVRVSSTGTRSFVVKLRERGRQRWVTLGRWPQLRIRVARSKARRILLRAGAGAMDEAEGNAQ